MVPDILVILTGGTTLLGGILSLYQPKNAWLKCLFFILFVTLGVATIHFGNERSRETEQANRTRDKALSEIEQSSKSIQASQAETARIQDLNTQLQKRLLISSERISDLSKRAIDTATGGDSFCYLKFVNWTQTGAIPSVISQGKYPIYDVKMRVVDLDRLRQAIPESDVRHVIPTEEAELGILLDVGALGVGTARWWPRTIIPFSNEKDLNFKVYFSARNGRWQQSLRYRKIGAEWFGATRVFREIDDVAGKPQDYPVIFEVVDKGYPRTATGAVEW